MDNKEFCKRYPSDKQEFMETVLNKYGENKWWLSDIPEVIGYWQLFEDYLVVGFDKFHEGIEKLLGRPVWTHEFGISYNLLKQQAIQARKGILTDEMRQDSIKQSFKMLENFCVENEIKLLNIGVEHGHNA